MRLKYTYFVLLLIFSFAGLWGCIDDPEFGSERHNAGKPEMAKLEILEEATTASYVVLKSAALKANGYPIAERGFAWSTDSDSTKMPENQFQKYDDKNSFEEYIDTIRNLSPGVEYFFWSYAKNEKKDLGFSIGSTETTNDGKGVVRTFIVEDKVRGTSAEVGGIIEKDGEGGVKTRGVYYSKSINMIIKDTVISKRNTLNKADTVTLNNLDTDATYYVQAFVRTTLDVEFVGLLDTLNTTDGKPRVDSILYCHVDENNHATLQSRIIDKGDSEITDRGFCWSATNSDPKKKIDCPECEDKSAGHGGGEGNSYIVAYLDDLKPSMRYFVRAYAANKYGTQYGKVKEFWTNSEVPTLSTSKPKIDIRGGTIELGGQVLYEGKGDIVEHGVCYSTVAYSNPEDIYENGKKQPISSLSDNTFSATFSDFRGSATYYLCAYARNNEGVGYGNIEVVETPKIFEAVVSKFEGVNRLRASTAYFMIDKNAYLLGGDTGREYTDELWAYSNGRWVERRPYPGGAAKWQTAVYHNGAAYVLGGFRDNKATNEFYRYDAYNSNIWTRLLSTVVDSAYQRVGFSAGDAIYFVGGRADTVKNNVWAYDFVINKWVSKADFPVKQYGGIGLTVGNEVYAGLGKDDINGCNNTIWKSSDMNTWIIETSNSSISGGVLVSTVHKDKIYIIDESFRLHEYDPENQLWKSKSIVPVVNPDQDIHCMYIMDDLIYIGLIGNSLYIYDPLWDN